MIIYPCGSRPTKAAPEAYFTGEVRLDPVIAAPDPSTLMCNIVSFAPGARTNWHTHAYGQVLHVTQGAGLIANRGEAPRRIRAGDTVWIPAHAEHWHGAAPDTAMTHMALQESRDGSETTWLDPVSETDYARTPASG